MQGIRAPAPASPRRGLLRQRSAAVAVMFSIMIVPILMLTGLVINFGWVLQAKTQLDLAADSAALAAARTAAAGYAAGQTTSQYMAEAQSAASQWFATQAGTVPEVTSVLDTPVITQNGRMFTATVSYAAIVFEVAPSLFNWLNQTDSASNATIANSSSAVITANAYGTVDFLLDYTGSMMLPATDTDLALLQQAEQTWLTVPDNVTSVNNGANGLVGWNPSTNASYPSSSLPLPATNNYCAFACHWSSTGQDYYAIARAVGETLRLDVVQSATVTAVQQMEALEQVQGQLSLGIFRFGASNQVSNPNYVSTIFAETPLDPAVNGIVRMSAGGTAAIAAMQATQPLITPDIPFTDIGNALSDLLALPPPTVIPPGTGNTAASPLKSLILVTDGVEDDTNPQSIPSTEGPIDPSVCNAIKNAGYTLYILYTPYNSEPVYLPNNINLQPYITGASTPSILSAMQSCASAPADVIQATSPSDIQSAMVALVQEAVGSTTQVTN